MAPLIDPKNRPLSVASVSIESLFGSITYPKLKIPSPANRLCIVYGENGTGKTTILKIIFNLLSSPRNKGHRTNLLNTRFTKATVKLTNGVTIVASRQGSDEGPYDLILSKRGKRYTLSCDRGEADKAVFLSGDEEAFFTELERLELDVFLITDDRQIFGPLDRSLLRNPRRRRALPAQPVSDKVDALALALDRLEGWISQQVIAYMFSGDTLAYESIFEILRVAGQSTAAVNPALTEKRLLELGVLSRSVARFGISSRFNEGIALAALKNSAHQDIVEILVNSFLDGAIARVRQLHEVTQLIDRFLGTINNYMPGKEWKFNIQNGLQIFNKSDNSIIDQSSLSSGERHLAFMLSSIMIARSRRSIFIIDEPEISLNIKWQRQLIDSLLDLTAHSPVQFLLASHSHDLIASHYDDVVNLNLSM